jgi:DNA-binding IscR family transcriptional regulator
MSTRLRTERPERTEDVLLLIQAHLPAGRDQAIRASDLAAVLGVSERTVGALVAELIDSGFVIGSTCSGERPGYFLCQDFEDVRVGTAHIVARASESWRRVRKLRANAIEAIGPGTAPLFDLQDVQR